MTTPTRRFPFLNDPLTILAIMFTAFWGFVALAWRPIGDFGVETDFYGDFAVYARDWAAGRPTLMNGFRGPFYYIFLAGLSRITADLFVAAKVVSVISAGLALWFTGDLVRRIWGWAAGVVALLLMASSPTFIDYTYRACNDLVFLALVMASLNLVFRLEGAVMRNWAVAGALSGLAWMTRYNGSILLPAALLSAPLLFGRTRRTLVAAVVYVAGWILVTLPWLLFVQSRTGTPFWNKAYENIAIEVLTDDANRAQSTGFMSATNVRSLKDIWDVDPANFLRVMVGNSWDHLRDDALKLVGLPWAIVAVAGLVLAWSSWRNRRALAFLATGALTYLSLLPVFYNERFMLPLLPFWGAAAGGVAWWASRRIETARTPRGHGGRRGFPLVPALLGGLGILAIVFTTAGYRLAVDPKRFGGMPGEYVALMEDARRRGVPLGPQHPIAARKPHFPYLVGSPTVGVPAGSIDQLRGTGAHYLLVSGSEVAIYPSLASIWLPKSDAEIPMGLKLAAGATWQRPKGEMMAATLYAIEGAGAYTPGESNPFKRDQEIPPGYSRLDFIRLQLVEWILRSGARRDPAQLIRLMTPAAQEMTRSRMSAAMGAIRRGDISGAVSVYREILASEPGNRSARLGLAACALLLGRSAEHADAVHLAYGTAPGSWPPLDELKEECDERLRQMQTPQTLALAAAVLAQQPDDFRAHLAAAYALQNMLRTTEAIVHAEAVLRVEPNHMEAISVLNSLKEDIRKSGSLR